MLDIPFRWLAKRGFQKSVNPNLELYSMMKKTRFLLPYSSAQSDFNRFTIFNMFQVLMNPCKKDVF